MNYFPYLRGKQYELICLRENAELIAQAEFTPIVEPVRDDIGGLLRCIEALSNKGAKLLIVANPGCGPFSDGLPQDMIERVSEKMRGSEKMSWIYRFQKDVHLTDLPEDQIGNAVLHDSPTSAAELVRIEREEGWRAEFNIFLDGRDSGALYRRNFRDRTRVLIRDGFRKRKNADYLDSPIEHFSDLHITYEDEGMQGFGDFLTVGDSYAEGGGPAYAVAIHVSFTDPERQGSMFLAHFVSDSNDTPADPAGKFGEALAKLAAAVRARGSNIVQTAAIRELLALHDRGHYPGLGYVKKLSMQHHLEVMWDWGRRL